MKKETHTREPQCLFLKSFIKLKLSGLVHSKYETLLSIGILFNEINKHI